LGQAGFVQKPFYHCLVFAVLIHGTNMPAGQASAKHDSSMSIERSDFGKTEQGEAVDLYTFRNANGLTAKVLTYGAVIYSLEIPDKQGHFANVTANCASLADYETKSPCFGALLGRYANRIAHGQFMLEGQKVSVSLNAGPNHIHGGFRGFHKRVWKAEPVRGEDAVGLRLTYVAKDGEEGYPGTLVCTVLYELNNKNEWKMEYTAQTDKPTVVNLSNHAYWNLAGAQSGTVLDHVLSVNADKYLLADDALIPTGETVPVDGTPVDFRKAHRVGERVGQIEEKQFGGGYDHCLVVNHQRPGDLAFCAKLKDPQSGRTMEVFTTQPGVQIFSANFQPSLRAPGGYVYPQHLGLCLETQHFPDSPNKPQFPSTELKPGETYRATTIHKFGVEE
jgi:aldose 1-epimerase